MIFNTEELVSNIYMRCKLKTTSKLYQVDRKYVCFLKFLFEAYDGIALMKTIDPMAAKIELCIAPGCESDVEFLLNDLQREFIIRCLNN